MIVFVLFRIWLNRQYATHYGMKRLEGKTISKKNSKLLYDSSSDVPQIFSEKRYQSSPADKIELAKIGERSLDLISPTELGTPTRSSTFKSKKFRS